MASGQAVGVDPPCSHCGSTLRPHAPFCAACGQAVQNRVVAPPATPTVSATAVTRAAQSPTAAPQPADQFLLAGREVRLCAGMLDIAATLSPVVSLAVIGAVLGVPAVLYIVVPVAVVAVWIWQQLWLGLTGTTVGKAVVGLRAVRSADRRPPGFAAAALRSAIFGASLGLAALPVLISPTPRGRHDDVTGIDVIDVTIGENPLGRRQQTPLRRSIDRSLKTVQSPVPLASAGTRRAP
ncbi:RDD family protein [Mycobacterium sp. 141]|uniref:RDD family protein n=1 Tax=Mycobacterium sp. 141 TaxID=1120797 RepID=UPI000688A8CD|nr:RDD family protein [Mycobacterium sp. 141]